MHDSDFPENSGSATELLPLATTLPRVAPDDLAIVRTPPVRYDIDALMRGTDSSDMEDA